MQNINIEREIGKKSDMTYPEAEVQIWDREHSLEFDTIDRIGMHLLVG